MSLSSVSGIAAVATDMAAANTSQAVSIAVLKKAMDFSAQNATALIAAIPDVNSTQSLPAHLGQNINTTA